MKKLSIKEVKHRYQIIGWLPPFVRVRRKDTAEEGTFEFQTQPHRFFDYEPVHVSCLSRSCREHARP